MEAENKRGKKLFIFLIRYPIYKSEKNPKDNFYDYSLCKLEKVKKDLTGYIIISSNPSKSPGISSSDKL